MLNSQYSRGVIVIVQQVGGMKIYVAASSGGVQENEKIG
jgi:hypothetical protein